MQNHSYENAFSIQVDFHENTKLIFIEEVLNEDSF